MSAKGGMAMSEGQLNSTEGVASVKLIKETIKSAIKSIGQAVRWPIRFVVGQRFFWRYAAWWMVVGALPWPPVKLQDC